MVDDTYLSFVRIESTAAGPSWAALGPSLQVLASHAMADVLDRVGASPGVTPFVLHRRHLADVPERRAFAASSFDEAMQAYRDWAQSDASVGEFVRAYELPPSTHRTISLHVETRGTKPAHSILQFFDWTPSGPVVVGEPFVGFTDNDAPCPRFDDTARARLDAKGNGLGMVVLADKQLEPRCIAIVGTSVCWYAKRACRVYRVDVAGGPIHAVCTLDDDIQAMAVSADSLVATTSSALLRIDLRSGHVDTLADWSEDEDAFYGFSSWLVVDGDFIYVNDGGRIVRVPASGGTARVVGRADAEMFGLALRDGLLIVAVPDGRAICGIPTTGGSARKLVSTPGRPYVVAAAGPDILWTELDDGAVRRWSAADGMITKIRASDPEQIVSARDHVVWLEASAVMHLDTASGAVTTLASELARPNHVAIGDGVVACMLAGHDEGLGKIIRLDLPR